MTDLEKKKINIQRKRNTTYKKMFIIILPLLIVFLLLVFFGIKKATTMFGTFSDVDEEGTTINEASSYSGTIEEYGYYLRSNATDYQKELFSELKKTMSNEEASDEEKVALVVKNFIADMYTWTNKAGSYDVGGICYVYSVHRGGISLSARDGFYKYLSTYINDYGSDALLEVESVDVTTVVPTGEPYVYHNDGYVQNDNIWAVSVEWKYKDKIQFNGDNYATHSYMKVAKRDDGRIEILEAYGEGY